MTKTESSSALSIVVKSVAIAGGLSLAALAGLLYFYRDRALGTHRRKDLVSVPASKGLTGNLDILSAHLGDRLEFQYELYKKYGKIIHATVPGRNIIYDFDAMDLQRILSEPYIYAKGQSAIINAREFLGHGIFSANFDDWKIQRRLASNIFTQNNFRTVFMSMFVEESYLLVEHLTNASRQNVIIDLQDILLRSTLDSFVLLAMGKTVNAMKMKGEVRNGIYTLPNVPFMDAFDSLHEYIIKRTFNPIWPITEKFSGIDQKVQACKEIIDHFAYDVINEKRANKAAGTKTSNMRMDLLDFFLEATNEDGTPLSDEYLRDMIVNFLVAGRDTTAQTLSWTFWCLSQHPHILLKLRSEITSTVGSGPITYESLKDLKYCLAVFNETLRLHSNVAVARKQAVKDDVLPSGTKIFKGEYVEYSSWIMGRQEELWGEDCLEWKPDRWITKDASIMKPSPFTYPVFNAGPRICLGMNMAQQEAIIFLATLVRNFNFELVKEDDKSKWAVWSENAGLRKGRYGIAATLSMRGGVHFKVKKL